MGEEESIDKISKKKEIEKKIEEEGEIILGEGITAISSLFAKADEESLEKLAKKVPFGSKKMGVFLPDDVAALLIAIKMAIPQVTLSSLVADLIRKAIEDDPGLSRLYQILQRRREYWKGPAPDQGSQKRARASPL